MKIQVIKLLERRYPGLCDRASLDLVETLLYTPGVLATHRDQEMEERVKSLSQTRLETGEGTNKPPACSLSHLEIKTAQYPLDKVELESNTAQKLENKY